MTEDFRLENSIVSRRPTGPTQVSWTTLTWQACWWRYGGEADRNQTQNVTKPKASSSDGNAGSAPRTNRNGSLLQQKAIVVLACISVNSWDYIYKKKQKTNATHTLPRRDGQKSAFRNAGRVSVHQRLESWRNLDAVFLFFFRCFHSSFPEVSNVTVAVRLSKRARRSIADKSSDATSGKININHCYKKCPVLF